MDKIVIDSLEFMSNEEDFPEEGKEVNLPKDSINYILSMWVRDSERASLGGL